MTEEKKYFLFEVCYCRVDSVQEIYSDAVMKYGNGGYEWATYPSNDPQNPDGQWDKDNNDYKEISCHYAAEIPCENNGISSFNRRLPPAGKLETDIFRGNYCQIPLAKADKGDLIFFKKPPPKRGIEVGRDLGETGMNHIGIIQTNDPNDPGGWFFNADDPKYIEIGYGGDESRPNTGVGWSRWGVDEISEDGLKGRTSKRTTDLDEPYEVTIWRPKKCVEFWMSLPEKDEKPDQKVNRDPIVVNLDGLGIQTLGHNSEMYFDHDADGFKELSGWVAPGNGLLMLDRNGNGSLDDGSELFGDTMILDLGMKAENGFDALSHFDDNLDGKIDALDTIWSDLKIWRHSSYITTAGDG